jgi:hypothetical protein
VLEFDEPKKGEFDEPKKGEVVGVGVGWWGEKKKRRQGNARRAQDTRQFNTLSDVAHKNRDKHMAGTRQGTFKKQGTHRQGKYKAMQSKLTTQSKREQKVTKWSVQIVENGVGRAGFEELPVTLCKEVPEEIR